MKIHELKTVNPYFDDVWYLRKTFEVRKNDRDFNVGDILFLREYKYNECFIPESEVHYLGREILVEVTYILNDKRYCKEGYVILGFKEIHRNGWE